MIDRITTKIEQAREISLEAGISKYRAYFVNAMGLYEKYRAEVNNNLTLDGMTDCIIA